MMIAIIRITMIIIMHRCRNLESLFEQMKAATTIHMASILNVTDSAYYPCFRLNNNDDNDNHDDEDDDASRNHHPHCINPKYH